MSAVGISSMRFDQSKSKKKSAMEDQSERKWSVQ